MIQHFVTFYSPGTLVAEESTKPIDSWDTDRAMEMAHDVSERYGATPYGFRFSTRERSDDELDSHVTERSKMFYLGGEIQTVEQIKARNDPSDRILISNMEGNRWPAVVVNTNSWKWTQPFEEGDVLLEWTVAP